MSKPVRITLYKWAGTWGPFTVRIPCGECSLTEDVIRDCAGKELRGINVEIREYEWLSHWWKPLLRGGWHAPIVLVENRVVSQGIALNRGVLTQAVIEAGISQQPVVGTRIFGKDTCPHCARAKQLLADAGIEAHYHDVIEDTRSLYEMIARVKPIIGDKTPVTLPQIWMHGTYIGGADALQTHLQGLAQTSGQARQATAAAS